MNGKRGSLSRDVFPLSMEPFAGCGSATCVKDKITLQWKGAGEPPYILFDFGKKVAGLLRIKSHRIAGPDAGVRYSYGPYRNFTPFKFTAQIGDWQSEDLCAFRFLRITLVSDFSCPAELEIENVSLVRTAYPLERKGAFECDDTQLNAIWKAGVDTIQLCVQPNYLSGYASHYHPENREWIRNWRSIHSVVPYTIWDGVRRDRETWLGDAYLGMFAWLYAVEVTHLQF